MLCTDFLSLLLLKKEIVPGMSLLTGFWTVSRHFSFFFFVLTQMGFSSLHPEIAVLPL